MSMTKARSIARELSRQGFGCLPVDVLTVYGGRSLNDSALESAILQAFDRYEIQVSA